MVQEHFDLTGLNTFKIQVKTRYYLRIEDLSDLEKVRSSSVFNSNPTLILGGGSNMLFTKDYPGLVLHAVMNGITEKKTSNAEEILITAASGVQWHDLVVYCVDRGYGGIENLALIPGYCGAAPIQNIGAYGKELSQVLEQVSVIDLETGSEYHFNARECQFGYRHSLFKTPEGKKFFISSITLRLRIKNHLIDHAYSALNEELKHLSAKDLSIRDVFNAVVSVRKRKLPDPQVTGNAGSFFKNPVINKNMFESLQSEYPSIPFYTSDNQLFKIPAAWLIEHAGWKGKHIGAAGCHAVQPLVLINLGGATGSELLAFSQVIQDDVRTKFGVVLEREVNVV